MLTIFTEPERPGRQRRRIVARFGEQDILSLRRRA